MNRRVVVSGIGLVCPLGSSPEALWGGLLCGRSAVRRITRFDPTPFRSQVAGEISDFDPLDHMDARSARRLDRFAQLGVAAARGAVADAALDLSALPAHRTGVSLGSALGGLAFGEEQHSAFLADGPRAVTPTLAIAVYGGASGANIAIELDLRGPNLSNASSCASGAMAVGEALGVIQRGEADVMLAGGVEAPLAPLTFGAFSIIKAMSARNHCPAGASRPFDADRDGFVMSEAGAILVLEEHDRAVARGARIYAELVGYGHSNDAYHMTAPRPDGSEAARAICAALAHSGCSVEDIGYVNAHATGTPLGDVAEGRALRRALGEHGSRVPVSGTKGLYGHALGASGALEAAIVALALQNQYAPGTANLEHPDPDLGVNVVRLPGMPVSMSHAMSTSFGFGGANSALVLRRWEE